MERINKERVAVVGLGYVGLPVALAMSKVFETVGFDIDAKRVAELGASHDSSSHVSASRLAESSVKYTSTPSELATCTFVIVAVPTPVGVDREPDLTALMNATETVAAQLRPGAVVVYESTVYPGLTETVCGPLLERVSGLTLGRDIFLAYSPERINPGDEAHCFERVTKVVAAQDEATLERVAGVYSRVVHGGVYRAPSIAVAEAAKIVENTQRDVNIALMNEFALVFDKLGIRTSEVLATARTKWNFIGFHPGLVGGQCIGVAPLYLSAHAAKHGQNTELIHASRRINDEMVNFVARKITSFMDTNGVVKRRPRVGVLGVTFKENVADVRNSAVPKLLAALAQRSVQLLVHDPVADQNVAREACGVELVDFEQLHTLDVLVYAVPHRFYAEHELTARVVPGGVFIDLRSQYEPRGVQAKGLVYWSL